MILLEKEFAGIGEVKGFEFTQINERTQAYWYKVTDEQQNVHYEVFKRKNTPVCIDFENRIYSDTEFKEIYPKSKDFGVWAWTYKNYKDALNKFKELQ